MDDDFMTKCFEDNAEGVEFILRIILEQPELKIEEVHTQHVIKNLQGHSVQLDILAKDAYGKYYNIEVQRSNEGADIHRARYNGSIVDANIFLAGEKYRDLQDVYVIFITENDIFGKGIPIYHCERINRETGEAVCDGAYAIYVNGQYSANDAIGWLVHDFHCKEADEMHYKILAEKVRYFKEDKKGVGEMCKMMEDMLKEETKKVVRNLIQKGKMTLEDIAECVGFTIEEVQQLAME